MTSYMKRAAVVLLASAALGACKDVTVPNLNNASLEQLTSQPLTSERCAFGLATDTGAPVELTPRSAGLIASVGDMAQSVQSDPNESRALRSAATCVLGVWRAATGVR